MIPGNEADDSALMEVTLHFGGHPQDLAECIVELNALPLRYLAVWVPEVRLWRFSHGVPVAELKPDKVAAWVDLRDVFGA
jgi:hypothetical protein